MRAKRGRPIRYLTEREVDKLEAMFRHGITERAALADIEMPVPTYKARCKEAMEQADLLKKDLTDAQKRNIKNIFRVLRAQAHHAKALVDRLDLNEGGNIRWLLSTLYPDQYSQRVAEMRALTDDVTDTDTPDTSEAEKGLAENPLHHYVQEWNYDAESVIRIPLKDYVSPQSPNLRRLMDSILNCRENELLISGKRDCGKTYQIWQCLLTLHELIPNCQTLIARLEATTLGLLLTQLDTKILKYGLEDDRNPFVFKSSSKSDPRRHILFDNGSKMAFVGLDSGEKVLGGEHDIFWFNECHRQLPNMNTEDDWTKVLGGMVDGRADNWGEGRYLAIGDCNPSHKRHWAYLRAEEQGKMTHYRIKHQDHPLYYDWSPSVRDWTDKGITARADLERQHTKGTYEYMRMVEGEWCNAEGAVYPMFDTDRHIQPMQRADFTASGKYGVPKWRMSVDFGSGSINALGLIAYTPHDRTHRVFKEIYKSDIQVSELVKLADKMLSDYQIDKDDIEICYVDHQTDCWKQMRDAGYPTELANKDVIAGVETCKRVIGDGRWIVNADSLYEPDMSLAIRCYVHEVMAYSYKDDSKKNGSLEDDKPMKKDDHSMDWKRYYLHGEEGEEQLFDLPPILGTVNLLH